ncbi:phosphatase PAP2 family protein [Hippea maritima]|uniref:Protein tyrosine/serine phosphatase n=1 Tax=Hippea maritima (strain ATCC 700847 / DSM 10411 / MH2) TaxID=760142 RepID=F2LXI0_HIPMA|nr:phosphatase PAP2 family protein [Hippea maritima]AEA33166.1 protein tyrosine/serine phosphatase [Hippea maritima DSM 10411]
MGNPNLEIFKMINGYEKSCKILSILAIVVAKYLVFVIPIYLIWMFAKSSKYYKKQSLLAFYSALLGLLINYLISLIYFHPRPFMMHIGKVLFQHSADSSFPSDHVTLFLSLGFYLLLEHKLRLHGLIITALGLMVGLARVYSGVHWPLDIVGSFAVALLPPFLIIQLKGILNPLNEKIILIYERLWEFLLQKIKNRKMLILLLLLLVIASSVICFEVYMEENGNFHTVENGALYRSGQLDKDELLYYIKQYHIKSIVNLRGKQQGKNWYKEEIKLSKQLNLVHIDFRLSPNKIAKPRKLIKLINILEKIPKPILIHCKAGADRSGLVSAIWKYYVENYPIKRSDEQLSLLYLHFPYLGSPSEAMDKSFWIFVKKAKKRQSR